MRTEILQAMIQKAVCVASVLLLCACAAGAQSVNLTAAATTAVMPDGSSVKMWGYSCNGASGGATCAATNPAANTAANYSTPSIWSPVIITVPTGTSLTINLTNNLPIPPGAATGIPTSIIIAGQLGGGLGKHGASCTGGTTCTPSPNHDNQGTTWPIANTGPVLTPPMQGPRIQSFSAEVATGSSAPLMWTSPREGTYLLESGTHPSIQATMGLIGMLVVTKAAAAGSSGTAYKTGGLGTSVTYDAEIPLIFSEIDPAQNNAVDEAVNTQGFDEGSTHGIYLGGPVSSVSITGGGSGYTTAPNVTFGPGSPTGTAHAEIDTDPTSATFGQVTAIDIDTPGNYAVSPAVTIASPSGCTTNCSTATAIAALQLQNNAIAHCSGGAAACYPPVVNYSPLYYLINGVAFDKTHASNSRFATMPAAGISPNTGQVLVRLVNAGSRMHIPAIIGSLTGAAATPSGGFSLIAEDGNPFPGVPRIQSEVFMAAGKTYDVMINAPAVGASVSSTPPALPVFDRQLSLSANSISRDSGMLAYISVNNAGLPASPALGGAVANPDMYSALIPGQTIKIGDPAKGVIANDLNVFGVSVSSTPCSGTTPPATPTASCSPANGSLALNANGTFSYVPNTGVTSDWFVYQANGNGPFATVTLSPSNIGETGISLCPDGCTYWSNVASALTVKAPGILTGAIDGAHLPLSVDPNSIANVSTGLTVTLDANGGFAAAVGKPGTYSFEFTAKNPIGTKKSAIVTINFPIGSGLKVTVLDGADKKTTIDDYRWIIEEDRTFFSDPNCAKNPTPAGCPGSTSGIVPNFGTNFHTSFMPVVATGCTKDISCGAGQTILGSAAPLHPASLPGDVALCGGNVVSNCLDPNKRYYISVLPGDAAQPFIAGYAGSPTDCAKNGSDSSTSNESGNWTSNCGHGMGGAPIAKRVHDGTQSITVFTEPSPYPPATLSVFVFEDDFPLNGEHDAGGGIDVLSPNEPGLGGFQITLQDDAGGTGDATGTPTYDMFNMPLSNSLAGTIDPVSKLDACPISVQDTATSESGDSSQNGIVGMIVTCPTFESDGKTLSPLAGQALVKNLYQGRYGVVANPAADRIARGEEWLQTNTLDGQKAHDSFMRIGEPGYFQEFGPAGYHVTIGFANPKIINDRGTALCKAQGADCAHEVKGHITTARMSRTPDERLYGSGTHDEYAFSQCYVSIGDPDGAEFGFTKCDDQGGFDFPSVPAGNWKITTFDQWNDQVVDGITTPVGMCDPSWNSLSATPPSGCKALVDMGEVAVHQWQANIYTRTFLDTDYSGVSTDQKPGLPLVATNIRFRDGSFSNFNNTDLNGFAGFNEVFPLFNWYVIETDSTRYKNTGTHVVYDSGGPVDNPTDPTAPTGLNCSGTSPSSKPCEKTALAANLANTYEPNPLPADLSVPGAVYCNLADTADCNNESIANGRRPSDSTQPMSTGRIDPAWVNSYGWQGYSGQSNFLEFGKKPFAPGENGGIHGHVVYASTRPFDDPTLLLQTSWEPLVPHVRINLYKEGVADDGVTPTLTLVDHTETSSFDDWAQGVRSDNKPNMNCPGQGTDKSPLMPDPYFWFALKDQPQWLDLYNNSGTPQHALPYDSQYKCYDGMHNWNQLQPAPYDGAYSFPSVTSMDPATGKPLTTNCTACTTNPTVSAGNPADPNFDPYRAGTPMLPSGKYVVEVVVPEGYELVKEEDKNILIGDNFIAPVTQQFGGLGSIFILPDQASVASGYNENSAQMPTSDQGRTTLPSHESDTGSVETFWPCVGGDRVVPDYISLYPGSLEVAPFAGATRKLCDRKEITLTDQTSALAKFYIYTETHAASHYTGVITDDFTAEFDPFSPQFGEKYGPAYLPVSFKDWAGNEISRVYTDAWGAYNGLSYSTWEVNPPNPTGYGPTMMVGCMNDAGPVSDGKGGTMTDPFFQDGYSQFCYELPFMPAQTGYFDTPVVPTAAFAGDYNNPDCAYPDATPAIKEVDGDGTGPWVAGVNGTVTSVQVTHGGSYTSAPTVTFNNTGTGGSGAAATAVVSGSVTAVNLTNATKTTNRGYGAAPNVGFSGGGGSGAAATAIMTSSVTRVTIVSGGVYPRTGAGSTVTVTISGGGATTNATGTVATANINLTTKRVTGVTITNAGAGYTGTPTVTFSNGISQANTATGTAVLGQSVASVLVNNGGMGYTSAPSVSFTGGVAQGGQAAAATSTETGTVVAVNVTNGGSGYNSAPTMSFSTGTGSGASATASIETNGSLSITALGDQNVDNYEYVGPSANTAPYNQQKITRHYNFGAVPTNFSNFPALPAGQTYSCGSASSTAFCPYVTVGGKALSAVSWTSTSITGKVPSGIANCSVQQQAQFGGTTAQCGELVITAANGKQSIDTVTVTIGGKQPTVITGTDPLTASGSGSIQQAIDNASPGDLLIVGPGTHPEMILMWKPVRLQGVGAASSIIDANTHPAGKLDPWRGQVVCLFGLALNGQPYTDQKGTNPYDASGTYSCPGTMKYFSGGPDYPTMVVDRIPMEGILGWDTTVNGNLAEQLIEPSLMGAYEGAGITVLGKGVIIPPGSTDVFGSGSESAFPTGSSLLSAADCATGTGGANLYPSNFLCNPSSIDGLTVKNSSQGGGGILVHAWGHEIQIANNRVQNNQGTMSGGITIGQGEHPDVPLVGGGAAVVPPGSCIADGNLTTNLALPYCYDMDVNLHNNQVVQNASLGDELFTSTPAGGGGVTICNGSDYYKFNYNWVCGNMSTGDGAGFAHVGFSYDGNITHNTIMFNQSTNPTIVTNGGGLLVMGAPDPDPPCATNDQDCLSAPGSITPSDGTGPGLVIDANLILGNSADSGSGGGLRLQHVNGNDVLNFPRGNASTVWPVIPGHGSQPSFQTATPWNAVQVTNNILSNNVAGWDGGGVSLLDALAVNLVNNTITTNNSTASSGVLFQSLFAPLASTQGTNCSSTGGTQSCPQVAGLVSVTNSTVLTSNLGLLTGGPASVTCPTGHGTNSTSSTSNCTKFSVPVLANNVFWQNRSLMISLQGIPSSGFTNQQETVAVFNPGFGSSASAAATQTATGSCNDSKAAYWDIGVRGDVAPGDHSGGTLSPTYSLLTNPSENGAGSNNLLAIDPALTGLYCNGSLVPVEAAGSVPGTPYPGWLAPPGTNESNALPAPPFTLLAAATVDEGNNWINLRWGPLSTNVLNSSQATVFSFNPMQKSGSPVIDYIPTAQTHPATDFFGNPRPDAAPRFDIGAIEFQGTVTTPILVAQPSPLSFGQVVDTTSTTLDIVLRNDGGGTTPTISITGLPANNFSRVTTGTFPTGAPNCVTTLAAGASCTIRVQFAPPAGTTPQNYSASLSITATVGATSYPVSGAPVSITGTGVPITRSASVSPATLAFGNWATGSTSGAMTLTVTNTGNVALSGGTFAIGTSAPFSRPSGTAGGTCGTTLALGAGCTIKVVFAPSAATGYTQTPAVSYSGVTFTPSTVTLTGTGVATRASVSITPNPLTITLPAGTLTGTSTVTLKNTATAGGSSVSVTSVAVSGANLLQGWAFNAVLGQDACTGSTLAPGGTCTVGVRFTRLATGTHTGSITFTDTGAGSTQSGVLTGVGN